MPTNLPPEYFEAEERYKAAETPQERIVRLEELISTVPKHKGTDKLRADLRRRLSKMKAAAQSKKKKTGRHESVYNIDKEGAGQVVVVGPANVGKSALVVALTNATPEVADYPFTTRVPTPGMMWADNVQIQLIDTPPLDQDYVDPQLLDLIRRADIILLVVDLLTYPVEQLEQTIALLGQHRIAPRRLEDAFEDGYHVIFKPVLVVANKNDDEETDELFEIVCELLEDGWSCLPVSAVTGRNLDKLRQALFDLLGIIRVYSKPPGKEPDFSAPFVMKKGGTVEEFAGKIHKDFYSELKSARVWGRGVFDGQLVGRDHVLHDGDVVELRT